MESESIIVGGEESGGIALQGFIPERDGILIILYFLEMLAKTGKSVDQLLQELYAEYGERYFRRIDLKETRDGNYVVGGYSDSPAGCANGRGTSAARRGSRRRTARGR
jgi:phosphomannomutase